jgi:hypothetical protein
VSGGGGIARDPQGSDGDAEDRGGEILIGGNIFGGASGVLMGALVRADGQSAYSIERVEPERTATKGFLAAAPHSDLVWSPRTLPTEADEAGGTAFEVQREVGLPQSRGSGRVHRGVAAIPALAILELGGKG